MTDKRKKWNLVSSYPITEYQCGAKAGEQVWLKKDIVVQSHDGSGTGKVHSAGEIWTVFPGSSEPPIVLWLCQPDGHRHTWDDNAGFWEWFERI
jgi:hypothetical protein